jgi:histidinol-phosphate aminotransferase
MSRYWSDVVRQLTPYVPGEQTPGQRLVKLNTNENPYDPAPAVLEAIRDVRGQQLRKYPDPESTELRRTIALRSGLAIEQVFVGNGSDEVLAHTFQALLRHEKPLCFPEISYSFYPVWCDLYGIDFQAVPLTPDFRIDVARYPAGNGGVIIPNPNAPTGILLPLSDVRTLLQQSANSVVVIDEAYIDFGGDSAVSLINEFDNLLVIQTLSKSRSLAGLRIGVALGHRDLIEALGRVKNSFNSYPLDVVAQVAAQASLADEGWFQDCRDKVIASRERLVAQLQELGFEVLPSAANFVFVTHRHKAAADVFAALRERDILVRYFDRPLIGNHLRISIGTDEECQALVLALTELL